MTFSDEEKLMQRVFSWLEWELDNPNNDWSYIDNVDEIREIIHKLRGSVDSDTKRMVEP